MKNIIHPFPPALAAAALILASCDAPPPGTSVWEKSVSPPAAGADAGPAITQAFEELRAAARGGQLQRAVLRFAAGQYPLAETLLINRAALGDFQGELVLEGPAQGQAVLLGSRLVEGWEQAPASEVSPGAGGKVWVAMLPPDRMPKTLYDAAGALPRSRTTAFKLDKKGTTTDFRFPAELYAPDGRIDGLELNVRPFEEWCHNILPVAALDPATGRGTTAVASTYNLRPPRPYAKYVEQAWLENHPAWITQPGQWAADPRTGRLYLWPREGDQPADVRAGALIELVRFEGDEAAEKPLADVTVRGLTFSQADRESIDPDDAGLQHDWDFHDKSNAMLRLRWVENITVQNCRFTDSGASGLRADLYAQNVRVLGNTFRRLGGGGILFCGYGPGTKDLNKNNVIHGNLVEGCAQLIRHMTGIHLWQSGGNKVTRNLVRNLPYNGMVVSGVGASFFRNPNAPARELERTIRWGEVPRDGEYTTTSIQPYVHTRHNLIEGNEIAEVMQELGDGNGIYVRFASATGNVVRGNYVRDVRGPGIRTDGQQGGVVMEGNLILRAQFAGLITKEFNTVRNNFIVDVLNEGNSESRWLELFGYILTRDWKAISGSELSRNVFLDTGRGEPEFFHFGTYKWQNIRAPKLSDFKASDNLYWVAGNPAWAEAFVAKNHAEGTDPGSRAADPGMEIADGRMVFRGKVLGEMGIKPFDWDNVGLPDGADTQ